MNSDKYDRENSAELGHPVFLLAEGKSDVSFLKHLLEARHIGGLHYGFPTSETGGGGFDGFGPYVSSLPTRTGFKKLKAILVLYDNDSDPAAAFGRVGGLVSPADPYSIPVAPNTLGPVSVDMARVMLVPMPGVGVNGALETLLLQSAATSAATLNCVDAFAVCAGCGNWAHSHDAKMRLRCLIAAKCRGNSDIALTHIWGKAGNPIDLNHVCFDALVQLVSDVQRAVA